MGSRISGILSRHSFALLTLRRTSCASQTTQVQDAQQMLAAAGFRPAPAMTPEAKKQLALLPPLRLRMQPQRIGNAPEVAYAYADPVVGRGVLYGGPDEFARFQQLALQQRLADQHAAATEMQRVSDFGWGWGPRLWLPEPNRGRA